MKRLLVALLLTSLVFAVSKAELNLLTKPFQLGPNCESIKKVVEWAGGVNNIHLPTVIKIVSPAPLSGALGAFAVSNYNAIKMASDDINNCMKELGLPWRFKFIPEDTQTDPIRVLEIVRKAAMEGIPIVAGRITSRPMGTIMDPVNKELHIVVISGTSTAPSIRIRNYEDYIAKTGKSYIFWAITNDFFQGRALAELAKALGLKRVVIIYRNDDYGVGLAEAFKYYFEGDGRKVFLVAYDPNARTFEAELKTARSYNPDGVLFISFDEISVLIRQALQQGLGKAVWLFSETTGGKIIKDPFAVKVVSRKIAFGTAPGGSDEFWNKYMKRFGQPPMFYADYIYDTLWLSALAVLKAGKYNADAIRQALLEVGAYFKGYTGPKTFNPLTQETEMTSYLIWKVEPCAGCKTPGKLVKVGYWDPLTGLHLKIKVKIK